MEIREYQIYCEDEILHLYDSVGWKAYTDHPEVLRKGFGNSLLILGAYEGEELLGLKIGRASCRERVCRMV